MMRFALFGHPVGHSLSPVMHAASFKALGFAGEYQAVDVAPARLADSLAEFSAAGYKGLNLTVPHKSAALPLMDRLDNTARLYGAVNTVRLDADGLTGFNTDANGFLRDLRLNYGQTPCGRHIMILGCGGAGRALAIACAAEGAATLWLVNRTVAKAQRVAREIASLLPDAATDVRVADGGCAEWTALAQQADMVVQCTTAGLHKGDEAALPIKAFREGQLLYDLVYHQPVTPTMRVALEGGAQVVNGLGMLVQQGAESFKIWTGIEAHTNAMRQALEACIYG